MKIFVDENIPLITVNELRKQGIDVIDIRGTENQGITDEVLWEKVQKEKCLLVTTDKGFSNYREEPHHGILIIRLKQPSRLKIHQSVMQAIKRYSEKEWPGLMVVMRDVVQSTWRSHKKV
jgi:predicted nuclease of predicted toxin-antitoxin system